MTDYTPVVAGGQPATFTASAAVTGGQPVEVTGNMQVGPAASGTQKYVGIAGHDAPAGEKVTVHMPAGSIEEVAVSAAVTAGQHVKASGSGRVAPFTVGTDAEVLRLGLCVSGQATVGQTCRFLTA
ncbi:MAG: DUF2190 family protein [Micrococcales bacterium]|nr:DUF2190 family protein [Micrococcales bacterium]